MEINIRRYWRSYLFYFFLAAIDVLLIIFIAMFYYEKHQMQQWQEMRQKAIGIYNKGNLFVQQEKNQKALEKIQSEVILEFSGADMLSYISQIAVKNKLKSMKIQKSGDQRKKRIYTYKLSAHGSYMKLWSFVRDLEIGKLPLQLESVTMQKKGSRIFFTGKINGKSVAQPLSEQKNQLKVDEY